MSGAGAVRANIGFHLFDDAHASLPCVRPPVRWAILCIGYVAFADRCPTIHCEARRTSVHEYVDGHEHNRGHARESSPRKILSHSLLLEALINGVPATCWSNVGRIVQITSGAAIRTASSALPRHLSVRCRTLERRFGGSPVRQVFACPEAAIDHNRVDAPCEGSTASCRRSALRSAAIVS